MGAILQEIGEEMFYKTFFDTIEIVCKNVWKMHAFQFFMDILTDPSLPHPHINVEKYYFCVA